MALLSVPLKTSTSSPSSIFFSSFFNSSDITDSISSMRGGSSWQLRAWALAPSSLRALYAASTVARRFVARSPSAPTSNRRHLCTVDSPWNSVVTPTHRRRAQSFYQNCSNDLRPSLHCLLRPNLECDLSTLRRSLPYQSRSLPYHSTFHARERKCSSVKSYVSFRVLVFILSSTG